MKVFVANKWTDGFLDYCPCHDEKVIQVLAWINLERSEELYFVRPRNFRLVWNYFKEIGLREVLKKILSRSEERFRNEKFVSCGIGYIVKSCHKDTFEKQQTVAFLAPNYPTCVERITLPTQFIFTISNSFSHSLCKNEIIYFPVQKIKQYENRWWKEYCGWSPYTGGTNQNNLSYIKEKLLETINELEWQDGKRLQTEKTLNFTTRKNRYHTSKKDYRKSAVLFGYGNYAKTVILPNIKNYLNLVHIHEIDPLQIPLNFKDNVIWDTCSAPAKDENYDVFLIAGFHHTHTPLAISAIERGAYAVVEKPIVVTFDQLDNLVEALTKSKGHLFSCFHKRYLPMNRWAFEDMKLSHGDPVSYHCIVYEVPLPKYHWYRWPNSKSRLISNGCHWIDHFLFLNNFCKIKSYDLYQSQDGTIQCAIELINDAFFTMTLTDKGAERVGVQDYIELRTVDSTAKMINGAYYQAEGKDKIIRKKRINKMLSYKIMYQKISQAISDGKGGDSLKSIKASSYITLTLDNQLQSLNKR